MRDETGWIRAYTDRGALWIHGGNAAEPHALLTSGNHSDGFFNSRLVTDDNELLREAVCDLFENFRLDGGPLAKVKAVVGPQVGATKLASFLSQRFAAHSGDTSICAASPAKGERGGEKVMIFDDQDLKKIAGKSVLLCEDVLTTGGSVELAGEAVLEAGGSVLPFVAALVNRSGKTQLGGLQVVALINQCMSNWSPEECPLCKKGSRPLRPKDNWSEFYGAVPVRQQ